jgi:hypothetical protein
MRNSQDNVLEVWLDCDLVRVPFLGFKRNRAQSQDAAAQ